MAERIYLKDIVHKKQLRLQEKQFNLDTLRTEASNYSANRPSFYEAIAREGLSIIGEVKKASPSKGIIKEDFNPIEIAKTYEQVVDAISVLTEEDFFLGCDQYLKEISENIHKPTLCKDFIITPEQIYRAKLLGASAVLLIVAILSEEQLRAYMTIAARIGLEVLVEVHTKNELQRALLVEPRIIGINNRNLETFETDLQVTRDLRQLIPKGILVVSESGIQTVEDVQRLKEAHIDGVLVGESFMRADDIKQHAEAIRNGYTS